MPSAMILSAGLGTRLRPLTDECPKPLVPIGDRPALAHVLAGLGAGTQVAGGGRAIGQELRQVTSGATVAFDSIVINTHYLADHFKSEIENLSKDLYVSHEDVLLGTAGGLAGARAWLTPPVLVWNGDTLTSPPVARLLESAAQSGGLTLAIEPLAAGRGSVGMDQEGRVVRLRGESFGVETRGGNYIGVASLGADGLAELPARGCLIGDYALPTLRRGGVVLGVPTASEWFDIGTLPGYARANRSWLSERSGAVGPSASFLGPSVVIAPEVQLAGSIVGAGAEISGAGRIASCIIWPRAKVRAPLSDAVVTTAGRVVSLVDV